MRRERVEQQVLGAVRFLDATTSRPVRSPLAVMGDGLRLVRNREGLFVLLEASGPEVQTVELTVSDPGGRYLPRRFTLDLPRDPDPAAANSLFHPVDVRLYPAPAARLAPGSAVIRASVVREGTQEPLGGVLLRVMRDGKVEPVACGLTDWRDPVQGEALVEVPGGLFAGWTPTAVAVSLEALFDPAAEWPPDSDSLQNGWQGPPSTSTTLELTAGCTKKATLTVP